MNVIREVQLVKGYEMIQPHICFTQGYEVVLKLDEFSHLSDQFFWLSSSIKVWYLSIIILPSSIFVYHVQYLLSIVLFNILFIYIYIDR